MRRRRPRPRSLYETDRNTEFYSHPGGDPIGAPREEERGGPGPNQADDRPPSGEHQGASESESVPAADAGAAQALASESNDRDGGAMVDVREEGKTQVRDLGREEIQQEGSDAVDEAGPSQTGASISVITEVEAEAEAEAQNNNEGSAVAAGQDDLEEDDGENEVEAPTVLPMGNYFDHLSLSLYERDEAHFRVFGTRSEGDKTIRDRRRALLKTIDRLSSEEDTRMTFLAVNEAVRRNPLLLLTTLNARTQLIAEDFDPIRAAFKLASFWRARYILIGLDAYDQAHQVQPNIQDYLTYYQDCEDVMNDPQALPFELEMSRKFVNRVNEAKLAAMDMIIADELAEEDKRELLDARERAPELANSDEHKLLFLRAESMIEGNAAERWARYWKWKYELFGPDLACTRITMDNVPGLRAALENEGSLRLMPCLDAHGRAVHISDCFPVEDSRLDAKQHARASFYTLEASLEQESVRRCGRVVVGDLRNTSIGQVRAFLASGMERSIKANRRCVPLIEDAFHVILPSRISWLIEYTRILFRHFKVGKGSLDRRLFVAHTSHVPLDELRSKLGSYGLTSDVLPTSLGGDVTREHWLDWIDDRQRRAL